MQAESKQFLLQLARETLEHHFHTGSKMQIPEPKTLAKELTTKQSSFVTLHKKDGSLRGCVGHTEAIQPLYLGVIDNVLAAGFGDRRFVVLGHNELPEIYIEISVLSEAKVINYTSSSDLLRQIGKGKDGVSVKNKTNFATYLPQVWDMFSSKAEFLSSLCEKAGLPADEWKQGSLQILTYQAEVFGEKD
jgi:AmmeMemoRadiSam system protein A